MQMKLELKLSLLRIDISGEKIFPPVLAFFLRKVRRNLIKKWRKYR